MTDTNEDPGEVGITITLPPATDTVNPGGPMDWKNRYDGFKQHHDRKMAEMQAAMSEREAAVLGLQEKLKQMEESMLLVDQDRKDARNRLGQPPADEEGMIAWVGQYPELVALINRKIAEGVASGIESEKAEVIAQKARVAETEKGQAIQTAHPDAAEIFGSDEFKAWLSETYPDKDERKAINSEPTGKRVIALLNEFKGAMGIAAPKRGPGRPRKEPTPPPAPVIGLDGPKIAPPKKTWRLSEIQKLKNPTEEIMDQINEAFAENRVIVDS